MSPNIEDHLRRALTEVDGLMVRAFGAVSDAPAPGSVLDQCGLRDGAEIVEDYLRHGEAGVAFEHLLYMIAEPRLPISQATYDLIDQVGRAMGRDPKTWEDLRPSTSVRSDEAGD